MKRAISYIVIIKGGDYEGGLLKVMQRISLQRKGHIPLKKITCDINRIQGEIYPNLLIFDHIYDQEWVLRRAWARTFVCVGVKKHEGLIMLMKVGEGTVFHISSCGRRSTGKNKKVFR